MSIQVLANWPGITKRRLSFLRFFLLRACGEGAERGRGLLRSDQQVRSHVMGCIRTSLSSEEALLLRATLCADLHLVRWANAVNGMKLTTVRGLPTATSRQSALSSCHSGRSRLFHIHSPCKSWPPAVRRHQRCSYVTVRLGDAGPSNGRRTSPLHVSHTAR